MVGAACHTYGHDLAQELRAVGFINLDKRAQAIGVSRDWVAVAQDLDVWLARSRGGGLVQLSGWTVRAGHHQAWHRPV